MEFETDYEVNRAFNYARNVEKAICGLKGILYGITADSILNEQELLFLDTWLRSEEYLDKDDSDVIDLLDLIGSILEDGKITAEELQDLNQLINDIVTYKHYPEVTGEMKVNELLGLLSGFAADNVINDKEVQTLKVWLDENGSLYGVWPFDVVRARVNEILVDGVISQLEKEDLLSLMHEITAVKFEETGLAHGMATEFFEDEVKSINLTSGCFCFTGKFVSGLRKTVEHSVTRHGATTKNNITKSVDYLVIGTLASRDWRFSSHGRKIESAIKMKNEGHHIKIITERSFIKYMR